MASLYILQDDVLNPRKLPFRCRVPSWSVTYHRTEEAALARGKREAAKAARQCGGPAPIVEVARVRFT